MVSGHDVHILLIQFGLGRQRMQKSQVPATPVPKSGICFQFRIDRIEPIDIVSAHESLVSGHWTGTWVGNECKQAGLPERDSVTDVTLFRGNILISIN